MKAFVIISLLTVNIVFAQSNQDTVWLKDGTVIPCSGIEINDTTSRLSLKLSPVKTAAIAKADVRAFKVNGKMYPGTVEWLKLKCADWPYIQRLIPHQYEKVVKYEGLTADQLYSAFTIWVAESFKDANEVTNLSDPMNKTLIVKGNYPVCVRGWLMDNCNYRLHFSLKIMCKDGRFKFEISDGEFRASPLDRNSIDYSLVWLTTDNYFSKKRRTEGLAEPTPYSICSELNNFHRFIEKSLIQGASSFEKDDDW